MKVYRFVFTVCFFFCIIIGGIAAEYLPALPLRPVTFDNDTLRHLGRVVQEKDRLGFYWAACGVELTCRTTSVYLEMSGDAPDNYLQVVIDDCYENPVLLHCVPGRRFYKIAETLPDTVHKITLRRRTDPTTMGCFLYNIWVDADARLQITPAKKLKIDYYGDSVSSGHGAEAGEEDNAADRLYWNPMKAFTGLSACLLDADYAIMSKSGIGLMISWYDQVIEDIYDLQNPHDLRQKHHFIPQEADVVVVNILQNDSWLTGRMNPRPEEKTIVDNYCRFIEKILGIYSQAKIVCALGPMNITAPESPWPRYVENSVRRLQKAYPNRSISCCFFPYMPTKDHPTRKEHEVAARRLVAHIKTLF